MEKDLFRQAALRLLLVELLLDFEAEGSPKDDFFAVAWSEGGVACLELACFEVDGSEAWDAPLLVLADGLFISSIDSSQR